jgi:hypothetical protein
MERRGSLVVATFFAIYSIVKITKKRILCLAGPACLIHGCMKEGWEGLVKDESVKSKPQ